jgi:hypothetical protein
VFHDVPTQADLQQAEDKLSAVRKNRNSLAVFVVLLFGMLIAAGGFIYLQMTSTAGATADGGERLGRLEAERTAVLQTLGAAPDLAIGQLNSAVQALTQERAAVISELELDPAPAVGQLQGAIRTFETNLANTTRDLDGLRPLEQYKTIHDLRVRAGTLSAEIRQLLADPLRQNMPANVSSGLNMYNDGLQRAWVQVQGDREDAEIARAWKQHLEDSLQAYVSGLESEKAAILAWVPVPQGARPPVVNVGEVVLP